MLKEALGVGTLVIRFTSIRQTIPKDRKGIDAHNNATEIRCQKTIAGADECFDVRLLCLGLDELIDVVVCFDDALSISLHTRASTPQLSH